MTRLEDTVAAETLVVPEGAPKERLDVYVARLTPRFSRSRVRVLIEEGCVRLNGLPTRPRALVRAGDRVSVSEPAPRPVTLQAEEVPLRLLFEDEHIAVIDKPAGMAVHPGAGLHSGTLVNALLGRKGSLSAIGGEIRPGIVHRLDKGTSGCLVVAKSDPVHVRLSQQFATRTTVKWYLAICHGTIASQECRAPVGRHPVHRQRMAVTERGRAARTTFTFVRQLEIGALVHCRLWTGRTHQIRVHLQHLHHPLLGDVLYGGKDLHASRPMLHAWQLGFSHPISGCWMSFMAAVPNDFVNLGADADELVRHWPGIPDPTPAGPSLPG
ncbi:MAG TPA: RluA family pseudouridine synthase [Chthoniobacterales bacterium]